MRDEDPITAGFVRRWANGLERAAEFLPHTLSKGARVELCAAIVKIVMGEGWINLNTLDKATSLASPDPLSEPPPTRPPTQPKGAA